MGFIGLIIFSLSFAIFYGVVFYIHEDYDYEQDNWWYGGKK